MRRSRYLLALLAALLATTVLVRPASACGGLFCSTASSTPLPVDQNAERIVFEVHEDAITVHIQIQYVGDAESFAWVVPVGAPTAALDEPEPSNRVNREPPSREVALDQGFELPQTETPNLAFWQDYLRDVGPVHALLDVQESSASIFDEYDLFTSPIALLPSQERCDGSVDTRTTGGGCGGFGSLNEGTSLGESSDSFGGGPGAYDSSVTVFGHDFTDNYEFHVLGADRTEDLVAWLQDNDYNVSDNMTPVMDAYNAPGVVFLALKLRAERTANDIVPLALTYEGTNPLIPIRLTAVAAQPMMGVQVYIVAERPYVPANYRMAQPDPEEILFDDQGRTSYFEWVARAADEADGQLFVAEYIGLNPMGRGFLSRFYTRLSPHQMTLDPVFAPSSNPAISVSNQIDLTVHPAPIRCGELIPERLPSPCAFNYCGAGASCVVGAEAQVGCDCPAGRVAQTVAGPDGRSRVTCVPAENPLGVTPEAGGAFTPFDPCENLSCGEGVCVLRSGFATCDCEAGAVAVIERTGGVGPRCVPTDAGTTTFGPGAGSESRGASAAATPPPAVQAYATAGGLTPLPIVLALGLLIVAAAWRRGRV